MSIRPFSDVATCLEFPGQTIENSSDCVVFSGVMNADLTRDRVGLGLAQELLAKDWGRLNLQVRPVLLDVIRVLSADAKLPERLGVRGALNSSNPFE